jgi:hypothetical protein
MTVANSELIPEFQTWFYKFVTTSIINRYEIPAPVPVPENFLTPASVVQLLCDDDYPYDYYNYLYKAESRNQCWPTLTRQRLMIYPGSKYLVPGETGNNIFNLKDHDFVMLDALLNYRIDSTSVVFIDTTASIDSTAVDLIVDATAGIVIVNATFDSLNTPLSKLIYLYLDLKIYENIDIYCASDLVTDGTLLASCFEAKLMDEYFLYLTNQNVLFDINCGDEP